MRVTREALYEEVWKEAMVTVAKRYNVSSNYLAQVCKRLRVPHPHRGYWAKLAVGKAPERPALPALKPGDENEWIRETYPRDLPEARLKLEKHTPQEHPSPSRKGTTRHALVTDIESHYEKARQLEDGFLKPSKRLLVDIVTSNDTLKRALDVANTFFLFLEDRGHRVIFGPRDQDLFRPDITQHERDQYDRPWYPCRPTVAFVGTVAFGLTIHETTENAEVEWNDGKYVRVNDLPPRPRRRTMPDDVFRQNKDLPSGKLSLRAYCPYRHASWKREWTESQSGDLLKILPDIAGVLESETEKIVHLVEEGERHAQEQQREWEAQQRKWKLQRKRELLAKAKEESKEDLLNIVKAWSLAKEIELFFEDAENRSQDLDARQHGQIADRLKRARRLLGGVDALEHFRSWESAEERLQGNGTYEGLLEEDPAETTR